MEELSGAHKRMFNVGTDVRDEAPFRHGHPGGRGRRADESLLILGASGR
jgi:hypothetical protein